jgi:hypothetical protein
MRSYLHIHLHNPEEGWYHPVATSLGVPSSSAGSTPDSWSRLHGGEGYGYG